MDSQKTTNASVLGEMKPSKAIIKLAVPATLALLAKAVYNIVDTAYIGMLHSDTALAAVGVTLPLLLIMVSVENIFFRRRRRAGRPSAGGEGPGGGQHYGDDHRRPVGSHRYDSLCQRTLLYGAAAPFLRRLGRGSAPG